MIRSPLSDLTTKRTEDVTIPVAPALEENFGLCRIDFAQVVGKKFLVYGWVLGFTKLVDKASINLGGVVIDLVKQAIPVRRPDVAQHFSLETGNDEHGFYALIDLPSRIASIDRLALAVTLFSGQSVENLWPVSCDARSGSAIGPYAATFRELLPHLPRAEARRLVEFTRPALGPQAEAEYLVALPPPVRFEVDVCCVLENQILIVWGWLLDPLKELTSAQFRVGGSAFDLFENAVWIARPDLNPDPTLFRKQDTAWIPGFIFAQQIPEQDVDVDEASFAVAVGSETAHLTRPLIHLPLEARRNLISLLSGVDPDAALMLSERIGTLLQNCTQQRSVGAFLGLIRDNAVQRLPSSIQHANPRYALHVDQTTLVTGKGVFLVGWFNADSTASVQVVCHCGLSKFVVTDNWVRYRRLDVSSHLASVGIMVRDHDHGYTCYVPLSDGDSPYYLSVASESGEVCRMRVKLPEQQATLQKVRALVNPFDSGKADLRVLMERHIGPAVGAVWAARQKPSRAPEVRNYGPRPANPAVSVIVPLYGRHDFAEYQMALFADDPEFQFAELIYVVDDPQIVNEFNARCADLYGIYQVPFVVVYPGSNLGFAGANNCGAEVARGRYLLLMNSDVMPIRPGWLGDLLRVHNLLPTPGVLGVKLLFEDGSVQHAGMAFRRLAAWDNLWINHHPLKGQSAMGLTGVRQVPAVTAACALIEAALYRELGGFCEDYIIGDFEDSDLCLRASLAGRLSYVALDVELYHLERQSQNQLGDVQFRTNVTVYNCLLHNRRWADLIERMSMGKA
jgi:GT2 family glycosyltransferase